ncbi:hypothetical protein V1277_001197 [Bradyrhizobium sp. AZCC 1588]
MGQTGLACGKDFEFFRASSTAALKASDSMRSIGQIGR